MRIGALSMCGMGVFGALTVLLLSRNLPSVEQIANRRVAQSTKIFDQSGATLLYELSAGQKRTVISLEDIPLYVKDATIAIEDENFYQSPGFDWRGILRALWVNVTRGRVLQGGSTIAQQLAKNAFLSPEQTIVRKLKELTLAIRINRHYSKDEILALYLNEIPYGPTVYGIEAASQAYFTKPAKDLSLAESTLLAAIPKAPSYYAPHGAHVKELLDRQKYILKRLYELQKIDKEQYESAAKEQIAFAAQDRGIRAPHFVLEVQEYLVNKYGEDLVRTGGLRVITTLHTELQTIAEKAVADGAKRNEELYNGKNAALVALNPKNGHVLALVGSRDYFDTEREGNFNVATQGLRQPGSALKPFAYLAAFKKGYTPDSVLFDVPTEFETQKTECPPLVDYKSESKECFHPQNFSLDFRGPVSLRNALAQSINIPAVKTLYLAGMDDVLTILSDFGVTTLNDPQRYGLSLVLGGGEVRLLELVGAYGVLAQDGVHRPQVFVREVRDSKGKVLEAYKETTGTQVADAQYVRLVNDILSDVSARTGLLQSNVQLTVFPDHDVALKTGTSNDYRDAWALGYIPSLAVGVWAGNNDNTPMERRGSSILAAIPMWHAFMVEALPQFAPESFTRPESVMPEKPILRGEYTAGNMVHTILYSVDRRDPLGPPPQNPGADSQFTNWEIPVIEWAKTHIPDFDRLYNQPVGTFQFPFPTP